MRWAYPPKPSFLNPVGVEWRSTACTGSEDRAPTVTGRVTQTATQGRESTRKEKSHIYTKQPFKLPGPTNQPLWLPCPANSSL